MNVDLAGSFVNRTPEFPSVRANNNNNNNNRTASRALAIERCLNALSSPRVAAIIGGAERKENTRDLAMTVLQ